MPPTKAYINWRGALLVVYLLGSTKSVFGEETIPNEPVPPAAAVDSFSDFADLSLGDLLDQTVAVATHGGASIRRSPAIVTLIDKSLIRASGARDLLDVLRLIPGVQAGIDVWANVGLGVRGTWAMEGKVLILIDDVEMTELAYGTTPLLMRIPLQSIERIEIIRGPGSVLYGGFAELMVVRIITNSAQRLRAGRLSGGYGHVGSGYGHGQGEVSFSWVDPQQPDGFFVGGMGSYMRASGTNRTYRDLYGGTYNMQSGNRFESKLANVTVGYGGLSLRFFYHRYDEPNRDLFDVILPEPAQAWLEQQSIIGAYERKFLSHLKLTLKTDITTQQPYNSREPAEFADDIHVWRSSSYAEVAYAADQGFGGLVGVGFQHTQAKSQLSQFIDSYQLNMNNGVAYLQADYTHHWFNTYAGARLEQHEYVGLAVVPRAAFTTSFTYTHAKLMISRAFRAPTVNNISADPNINPEFTTAIEGELGYRPVTWVALVFNAFNNRIHDTITYFYDPENNFEGYLNGRDTGTRGLEAEATWILPKLSGNLNYSFYYGFKAGNDAASLMNNANLAFAKHKLAGYVQFRPMPALSLTPSAVLLSKRAGFLHIPNSDGEYEEAIFDPSLWLNFFARFSLSSIQGLVLGVGVFNLIDVAQDFLQPYDSGHGVFADRSRELVLRLEYDLPL